MSQESMVEDGYQPSLVEHQTARLIVMSGCSGGGKSSLLAELGRRGHAIYEEPGRQVVKEQLYLGGDALPWANVARFVDLTVSRSIHNMVMAARSCRLSFFDRGIIDQIGGLEQIGLAVPADLREAAHLLRYNRTAFFTPPWPEIFRTDSERRHSLEDASASYEPLKATYERMGYEVVELPKVTVALRADFILQRIPEQAHQGSH
jgi:predicted ATPase